MFGEKSLVVMDYLETKKHGFNITIFPLKILKNLRNNVQKY